MNQIDLQLYLSGNKIEVLNRNNIDPVLRKSAAVLSSNGKVNEIDPASLTTSIMLEKFVDWKLSLNQFDDAANIYRMIIEPHKSVLAKLLVCLSHIDVNEAEVMLDEFVFDDERNHVDEALVDDLISRALRPPSKSEKGKKKKKDTEVEDSAQVNTRREKNLKYRAKLRDAHLAKYIDQGETPPRAQTWVSTKRHKKKRAYRYNQRFAKGNQGMATENDATNRKTKSTAHLEVGGYGGKGRNRSKR